MKSFEYITNNTLVFLWLLLFVSCSRNSTPVTASCINISGTGSNRIDSLILPYRDSLQDEMGQVLGKSSIGMVARRPCSDLMNWVADAIFVNQTRMVKLSEPTICLLNTGGIRSTINKGEITIGDLYTLMPFDNQIVWVRMPVSSLPEIEQFIKNSGGEPISNAELVNGKLIVHGLNESHQSFYVITSDYLMNGGDKVTFFSKKLDVMMSGKLIRDALIEEVRTQQELFVDTACRISY